MPQLVRLASFLVFLALGLRLLHTREALARRFRTSVLLAYVVAVNLAAGVSQWDAWPFTSHTIAIGRARVDKKLCVTEFYGLDEAGRQWRIDPYAWAPVFDSILQYWCDVNLARLAAPERERVLGFLLAKAEDSRRRLSAGEPIGYEQRLGSGAGAPYWWLLPREKQVPASPYRGLQVSSACWIPSERIEDPGRVARKVVAEYRR